MKKDTINLKDCGKGYLWRLGCMKGKEEMLGLNYVKNNILIFNIYIKGNFLLSYFGLSVHKSFHYLSITSMNLCWESDHSRSICKGHHNILMKFLYLIYCSQWSHRYVDKEENRGLHILKDSLYINKCFKFIQMSPLCFAINCPLVV